jgi:hypothetical protein
LVEADSFDLENMKAGDRIENGNVGRARTATHDRRLAKKDCADPIESLGQDQESLAMSSRPGLVSVDD